MYGVKMINKKHRTGFLLVAFSAALVSCTSLNVGEEASLPLTDGPLPGKFIWHDLVTDDVPRARDFYGRLFGWTFEDAIRPEDGGAYTLARAGNRYVAGMVQREDAADGANLSRWLGYLSVGDVDRAVATTIQAGGETLVEPLNLGPAARAAAIQDPQGAVVGLAQSRVGDPADGVCAAGDVVWKELLTSDLDAAAGFYAALSGLQTRTLSRRGGIYVLLEDDTRERAGILENPLPDTPSAWLTAFAVDDPASAAKRAVTAGGTLLLAPSEDLREGSLALVQDPTGALLVLQKWPL